MVTIKELMDNCKKGTPLQYIDIENGDRFNIVAVERLCENHPIEYPFQVILENPATLIYAYLWEIQEKMFEEIIIPEGGSAFKDNTEAPRPSSVSNN